VLADHLPADAELLVPQTAVVALATRGHVVDANTIANAHLVHLGARTLDDARHLVAECDWELPDWRSAGTVVRVRVADASSVHTYQDVIAA
jgi:hypothetical protein